MTLPQPSRVKIHRSTPDEGYAQLRNTLLRDESLSFAARGLLVSNLSRPEDWSASAERILALARLERGDDAEGIRAIRRLLRELERAGYLERRRVRVARGRLNTELHFYDVPAGRTDRTPADRSVTDRSEAAKPVTDLPVTDRSAIGQSSRRQSTKTEKKKDHEDTPLSLGRRLQQRVPDLTDEEREPIAESIFTTNAVKNPIGWLRTTTDDDLAHHVAVARRSRKQSTRPHQPPCTRCGRPGHEAANCTA